MKTLVIGPRNYGDKNNPELIAESIGADLCFWEDLVFDVATNNVKLFRQNQDLLAGNYDLVLSVGWYKSDSDPSYYDVAYAFSLILDHAGIRYWNSEMSHQRPTTKLGQMVSLALAGFTVPHSFFSLTPDYVLPYLTDGEPYVVKAISASRGTDNYLCRSCAEIKTVLNDGLKPSPDRVFSLHFLVQPFIENDHDLRVICFGEPKLLLKRSRTSSDTHLNNTSRGGRGDWLSEIPPDLADLSLRIIRHLGRELGGVDFIETPQPDGSISYCCLEVNAIPQLTSGTDVARKMAAFKDAINSLE